MTNPKRNLRNCHYSDQSGHAFNVTFTLIAYVCYHATGVLLLQGRAQELWESRDDRRGLPVPNSPYSLRARKTTLNLKFFQVHVTACRAIISEHLNFFAVHTIGRFSEAGLLE